MGLPLEAGAGSVDLKRGVDALSSFTKSVDAVLGALDGSPAGRERVAGPTLPRESLAGGSAFGEAIGLHAQYARAHERVGSLSTAFGLQVEALRIAVHGADVGFDNLEEEARRRFHEIEVELDLARKRDQERETVPTAQHQAGADR
jgi:hypothetical protein